MYSPSIMMPTWPAQKTRSPRWRAAPASTAAPIMVSCRSVSRGAAWPAAIRESCTRPEQSSPIAGAPAPEIGRAEEALGNGDEIALRRRIERRDMALDHGPLPAGEQPVGRAARLGRAGKRQPGAERQAGERRQLQVGAGIEEGPERRDPVGRLRRLGRERIGRHIADIGIGCELAPRPAFRPVLEDDDGLAEQRFALKPRIGPWRALDGRGGGDDPARHALDEARGLDRALQPDIGKVRAPGMETGVEGGHAPIIPLLIPSRPPLFEGRRPWGNGISNLATQHMGRPMSGAAWPLVLPPPERGRIGGGHTASPSDPVNRSPPDLPFSRGGDRGADASFDLRRS